MLKQSFSESCSKFSHELENQLKFYSTAIGKAIQVAILPVDIGKFNILGRELSKGKIKSSLIPNNSDFGTYNDF